MKRSDIPDKIVCRAFHHWRTRGMHMADSVLREWTSAPEKVIYAAMERAYDRGLIECGVSLRSGWLTDKGRDLLATNSQFGNSDTALDSAEAPK